MGIQNKSKQENLFVAVAVIDLSISGLFIYDVPASYDCEQIEDFIRAQGRHLSNCSWGEFDGEITDLRN